MTSVQFSAGDGTTVRAETEVTTVEFRSHRAYDPDWSGYDSHGHFHVAVKAGRKVVFPTLRELWLTGPCGLCNDVHAPGEVSAGHECRWCGEDVRPGTRHVPGGTQHIPGVTTYTREGWIAVSGETAQELVTSGSADQVTTGLDGGFRAHIYQMLTKSEFQEYLRAAYARKRAAE